MTLSAAVAAENSSSNAVKLGQFIPVTPPQPEPQVTLTTLAGQSVGLSSFKGEPLVINLWATWCQPCLAEMPSLDQFQQRIGGRIRVLAVSEDQTGAKKVQPFVAQMNLHKLAIYLDPNGSLLQAFSVRGLPTSIIIDAQGRVVGKIEGASDWNSPQIAAMLEPYLLKDTTAAKPAASR